MTQTNIKHGNRTSRRIRRVPIPTPTVPSSVIASPLKTTGHVPIQSSPVKSAAVVTPIKADSSPGMIKINSSPPVDTDIDKFHTSNPSSGFIVAKDEEHDDWFDAVLNQCNITGGSNNNKYYRLQLLLEISFTQQVSYSNIHNTANQFICFLLLLLPNFFRPPLAITIHGSSGVGLAMRQHAMLKI